MVPVAIHGVPAREPSSTSSGFPDFLGGLGGCGGDKNVIHTASMPKTLVCTAFSPLCTTYCTRMWNKKICHKRPWRPGPKHWAQNAAIYSVFTSLS